ncbi:extracellular solute-binding protein [Aquibacillus salsiterrae]|uniref:Extracellular solute-binding protein n=1 Tax=Aquibacillus salsiterrae TaxID=2950439 RepID=A0A9X4AG10_9BACI|nr:extracellular solute-binding protein [Aquibacillus salsiterrae]MDC3418466.1 extracellular solute-binding protein [Aquibacillus salsiterrae]
MKKWMVTIVFVLFAFLAACSGGGEETAGSGDSSEGDNAESTAGSEGSENDVVEIEYWQYNYDSKVQLMDELIKEFEEQNPNIKVTQTNFPYEQYNEKVATLVPAGRGPDVINLYYGWVPKYVDSGFLQPLPQDPFSPEFIEEEFFPLVNATKLDGEYWTIPTAVRTLALFYNKDLFEKAGLDAPPKTWDELVSYAKQLTERDENGQLVTEGMAFEPGGQLHNWFRDALVYQAGGQGVSEDRKEILWDETDAGLEAFRFMMELATKHKVGEQNFYNDDVTAFKTGNAAMNIDGSFRLGTLANDAPDLNYGTAPLPSYKEEATQASFWTNGIVAGVEGKKLEAATKFLEFLTSKEVMERWIEEIGELPAKQDVALQDKYLNDELKGPFIKQLPVANAHFFVDEKEERELVTNAADKVLLEQATIEEAYQELVDKTQQLFDEYWENRE